MCKHVCSFPQVPSIGAFAKLRKATVSFGMSVCLSVSELENSAPTGRIFIKFDI